MARELQFLEVVTTTGQTFTFGPHMTRDRDKAQSFNIGHQQGSVLVTIYDEPNREGNIIAAFTNPASMETWTNMEFD